MTHANGIAAHTAGTATVNSTANDGLAKLEFSDIRSCIADFAAGNFLIVLDAPTRENEGDLIIAARHLTPAKCAFMIRHTSGYLCAPLSQARAKQLDLPAMVALSSNEDPNRTAYAVTVDAASSKHGAVTTGISAHDRSATCRVLADGTATAADLRRPGHVVPLLVREGGVRARKGHTEAGWELARLAGLDPEVAVIGEMVIDGHPTNDPVAAPELHGAGMMRATDCIEFGRKWGIRCCTIQDLVEYVEKHG